MASALPWRHGRSFLSSWHWFPCHIQRCSVSTWAVAYKDRRAHSWNGTPLRQSGVLLQQWARQILSQTHPEWIIQDAEPGTCSNGQWHSRLQSDHRIEIESSHLGWSQREWKLVVHGVKFPPYMPSGASQFDDLHLVLSPKWLHLVKHDLHMGISTACLLTGDCIQVRRQHADVEQSIDIILQKLCRTSHCLLMAKTKVSLNGDIEVYWDLPKA